MLESKPGILIVSLILALFMFLSANKVFQNTNLFESNNNSDEVTIENVPVTAKYDSESYYVSGVQNYVQVQLNGTPAAVKRIETTKDFEVVVDLSTYSPGEYEVSYTVRGLPDGVEASILPEKANITIQNLVERTFEVQAEVNDSRVGSNYTLESIQVEPSTVKVRGGEMDMERIQFVRAMLTDSSKITEETTENVQVNVFDAQYNKLDVQVEPGNVSVKIEVQESSKEVPVSLQMVGELPKGYQIDSISLSKDIVKLYGSEEVLNQIYQVDAELDLSGIKESGDKDVRIQVPDSITRTEPAVLIAKVKVSKQ